MSFDDFTAIPDGDPQTTPDEELQAALAGAIADQEADGPTPAPDPIPIPFGRSWLFDFTAGDFVLVGGSPATTSEFETLAQWCEMAIHSARYAHPVFSDEFGMEQPTSIFGQFAAGEALADWQAAMTDALMVHERITAVENFELRWESSEATLYVDSLDIVTDADETITVSDVTLQVGGYANVTDSP